MINQIESDATKGGIIVTQSDEATPYSVFTTGVIMPTFAGVGAPSVSTLAAGAYYRLYCYWLDITDPLAPNLWICVTAGDASTSVWYSFTQC